jgi:alpha-beta hydrolase superfamily lysophospholipase
MIAQEVAPAYVEERLVLEYAGVRSPAVIARPLAGQPVSAVLLIPGSLFIDVDGNMPFMNAMTHAYADLARQLAGRGHIVLRYAKTGPGTGSEVFDSAAAQVYLRFRTRVDVARKALDLLRQRAPASLPLVLAGHSEGSVVAGLTALEDDRVAAVVSLSGPSTGLLDIMREQLPLPANGNGGAHARFDTVIAAIRRGEALPSWTASEPTTTLLAGMDVRALRYLADVDATDPKQVYAQLKQPVLIVQGGRDLSVREHHGHALAAARSGRPTQLEIFPELQHMYKFAPADLDAMRSFQLATESDPAVTDAIDGFIRRRF